MQRAIAGAEHAGDLRLLAAARVIRAEILLAAGDRSAAREQLVVANRWYAESGAGDGAKLAADLLASLDDDSTGSRAIIPPARPRRATPG